MNIPKVIVANWKSNKTIKETEEWLHLFDSEMKKIGYEENKKIIIAPSFTSLEHAHYCSEKLNLPVYFASQNISQFDGGAYTGEVNGFQVKELAEYVIIGHSERRKNFNEDNEIVNKKIEIAIEHDLIPIICISEIVQVEKLIKVSEIGNAIIAYEPLFAIGSGYPDTPENANKVGEKIKNVVGDAVLLYGGSVTPENIKNFTEMEQINGVLVGGASLDPLKFSSIIKNA